jgi:hypothetical protein
MMIKVLIVWLPLVIIWDGLSVLKLDPFHTAFHLSLHCAVFRSSEYRVF